MAGYIVPTDVETLVPASEIRDLLYRGTTNPPATYVTSDLQLIIDDVEGYIDSKLQGRYNIPLTMPVPPLLKYYAKIGTRKFLWTKARQVNAEVDAAWLEVKTDLDAISKGELPLGAEPEKSERSNATAHVTADNGSYDSEPFSREAMERF